MSKQRIASENNLETSTRISPPMEEVMWIGARAIADGIGKSERQAQNLLETNRLPAFQIGRIWHMRPSTFLAFIEDLEEEARKAAWQAGKKTSELHASAYENKKRARHGPARRRPSVAG